jgi:phage protein U
MIGTFGPIVFVASADLLNTFNSFSRKEQGRWAKHDVVLKKPVSEFLGPDLGTISFNMRFDVSYGMNPRKELDKLVTMARGEVHPLIIGGRALGFNKWSLQSVSENWTRIDNRGNVLVADISVELEEYV